MAKKSKETKIKPDGSLDLGMGKELKPFDIERMLQSNPSGSAMLKQGEAVLDNRAVSKKHRRDGKPLPIAEFVEELDQQAMGLLEPWIESRTKLDHRSNDSDTEHPDIWFDVGDGEFALGFERREGDEHYRYEFTKDAPSYFLWVRDRLRDLCVLRNLIGGERRIGLVEDREVLAAGPTEVTAAMQDGGPTQFTLESFDGNTSMRFPQAEATARMRLLNAARSDTLTEEMALTRIAEIAFDLGKAFAIAESMKYAYLAQEGEKRGQQYENAGKATAILKTPEDFRLFNIEFAKNRGGWTEIAKAMTGHGREMNARTARRYAERRGLVDSVNDDKK